MVAGKAPCPPCRAGDPAGRAICSGLTELLLWNFRDDVETGLLHVPGGPRPTAPMTISSTLRPFPSCWSISAASRRSGPGSRPKPLPSASGFIGCASSRSAPAITAISRTDPIRPAGCSSSSWPAWRRARRRRACSGGAAKHRHHHLFSDTAEDVHSPRQRGFLYSHLGWIFARQHGETDLVKIADFARYPELMLLHTASSRCHRSCSPGCAS